MRAVPLTMRRLLRRKPQDFGAMSRKQPMLFLRRISQIQMYFQTKTPDFPIRIRKVIRTGKIGPRRKAAKRFPQILKTVQKKYLPVSVIQTENRTQAPAKCTARLTLEENSCSMMKEPGKKNLQKKQRKSRTRKILHYMKRKKSPSTKVSQLRAETWLKKSAA